MGAERDFEPPHAASARPSIASAKWRRVGIYSSKGMIGCTALETSSAADVPRRGAGASAVTGWTARCANRVRFSMHAWHVACAVDCIHRRAKMPTRKGDTENSRTDPSDGRDIPRGTDEQADG